MITGPSQLSCGGPVIMGKPFGFLSQEWQILKRNLV